MKMNHMTRGIFNECKVGKFTKYIFWIFEEHIVFTEKSNRVFIATRAQEAADTQPDDGAVSRFPFVVSQHKMLNVYNSRFGLHVITALV